MKKLILVIAIILPVYVFGQFRTNEIYSTDSFKIEIPKGNKVIKITPDTADFENIYIKANNVPANKDSILFADTAGFANKSNLANNAINSDSSLYSDKSDSSNFAELSNSARNLIYTYVSSDVNFYIETTGSDITGDGSLLNPWQTLNYAIEQLEDFYICNVTINVGSGIFYISVQNFYRLMQVQTLGFYEIAIKGETSVITTLSGRTQDATNPFKYTFNETFTPGALTGMFVDGSIDIPIADNGDHWCYIAVDDNADLGEQVIENLTTVILNDADHVAFNAATWYGRGGIVFYNIKFSSADTNKSLRMAAVGHHAKFQFRGCNITALNLHCNNIDISTCHIISTSGAVQIIDYDFYGEKIVFDGDAGSTDKAFVLRENGSMQLGDAIIKDFGIGFQNADGYSFINTSGNDIMLYNVTTGYNFYNGVFVKTPPNLIIENVSYLYTAYDSININCVFDKTNIIGVPSTSWVNSDNGYRVNPANNYNLYIKGIHTKFTDLGNEASISDSIKIGNTWLNEQNLIDLLNMLP